MRYKWLFTICLVLAAMAVQAQNYSIDWYSIDGGGGSSSGSGFSITGTIGQPDASRSSGGNYAVDGGFWGIISAIQAPGGPFLRVEISSTNTVLVAWPNPSTGFNLQQNPTLDTNSWASVTNIPLVVGEEKLVIVTPPAGNRFFRLKSP
jgi:hypothetical protein